MAEQSGIGPLEGNCREGRGAGSNSHSRPHTLRQKSSMTSELPLFLKAIKRVLLQEQLRWELLRSWRLRGEIKRVTSLTSETIPPITDRNTILPHSCVTDQKNHSLPVTDGETILPAFSHPLLLLLSVKTIKAESNPSALPGLANTPQELSPHL